MDLSTTPTLLEESITPYKCPECDEQFAFADQLTTHSESHSSPLHPSPLPEKGERQYKCSVCGRRFEHSGKLRRHMRTHTGERPHKCTICGNSFVQSGQLVIHTRMHTGEKPYKCNHCEKAFTCSKQLKVHNRTHTGEKPYECDICGKTFGYNHVLKVHKNSHLGERMYKCTLCSEYFSSKKTLSAHIKEHADTKNIPKMITNVDSRIRDNSEGEQSSLNNDYRSDDSGRGASPPEMNQFETKAPVPSTSSGFSRTKTHDLSTSSRFSRMIDAQIQQQLPQLNQPMRTEDSNIRFQNLNIDDSSQYRSRYVQKVLPYGGETSMNIREIGNNKRVPMITDSYLQRVVRRRDERNPYSSDSGFFEKDVQSGRNIFPELNNSRNSSRDIQEQIMYSFSDNDTFLTQRNVPERKSLTSDHNESLIYREIQERKQKIDESNYMNFRRGFEETNAMNRSLDFSGNDLLRPSNAYKSNLETPDSNVLDIRRRNERRLNESHSSSRFHSSNNADIHKDIWHRNNKGVYSGKSDFMSNYHDMNNMEVSDDSKLHSPQSHTMGSSHPSHSMGSSPPSHSMGGSPPSHSMGSSPPSHSMGGSPPSHSMGSSPPSHSMGGSPPSHSMGSSPPSHSMGGSPPSHSMESSSISPRFYNLIESYAEGAHVSIQHSNPRNIPKITVKDPETLNKLQVKTEDCDDMNTDTVDTAIPVELYNEKLFHKIILVLMNLLGEKNIRQFGYPHTCVDTILQKTLLRIKVQPCTEASLKDVFDRTLLNFRYLLEYCVDERKWDILGWKDKNVEDIIEEFMQQIIVERVDS